MDIEKEWIDIGVLINKVQMINWQDVTKTQN